MLVYIPINQFGIELRETDLHLKESMKVCNYNALAKQLDDLL